MTGAFLFSDPSQIPPAMPSAAAGRPAASSAGATSIGTSPRWNDNCVFCHNVAPNPARDPGSGRFATSVAELGVACEACHGPGAEHVARNGNPLRRWALQSSGGADPTIVNPSRLSPARAADLCGRCHGQRIADQIEPLLEHGDPFVPGDDLAIESAPLWRDTPLHGDGQAFSERFWDDGTPRLTAYEYQGLLQSPCTMRGPLTCTSCHGMHEGDPRGQIRARFGGRDVEHDVHGCHAALATPEAARLHAHHDPAGEGGGGRCVSCHMPRIVYGVLDVHRSHRIEVPDAGAGRRRRPPRRLHELSRRADGRLGRGGRAQALGRGAFCAGRPGPGGDVAVRGAVRRSAGGAGGGCRRARPGSRRRRRGPGASRRGAARRHGAGPLPGGAAPRLAQPAPPDRPRRLPGRRARGRLRSLGRVPPNETTRSAGCAPRSAIPRVAPPPALTALRAGARDRDLEIGE